MYTSYSLRFKYFYYSFRFKYFYFSFRFKFKFKIKSLYCPFAIVTIKRIFKNSFTLVLDVITFTAKQSHVCALWNSTVAVGRWPSAELVDQLSFSRDQLITPRMPSVT